MWLPVIYEIRTLEAWMNLTYFLSYWHNIQVTTKNFPTGATYKLRDTIPIPL